MAWVGGFSTKEIYFTVWRLKVQEQHASRSVPGKGPLAGSQRSIFSQCPHKAWQEAPGGLWGPVCRAPIPSCVVKSSLGKCSLVVTKVIHTRIPRSQVHPRAQIPQNISWPCSVLVQPFDQLPNSLSQQRNQSLSLTQATSLPFVHSQVCILSSFLTAALRGNLSRATIERQSMSG